MWRSTYNYDKTGSALKQMTGDQRFYRSYQTQLYAQDTWKVLPNSDDKLWPELPMLLSAL